MTAEIDREKIRQQIEKTASLTHRVEIASRVIADRIKSLMERDPQPNVLILAYPKWVDFYCVQGAIGHRGIPRKTALEKAIEKVGKNQMTLERFFGEPIASVTSLKPIDLRSMVKAVCMEYKAPIQILRQYTINPYNLDKPNREDDATTFWNLVVALLYKANHLPWACKD